MNTISQRFKMAKVEHPLSGHYLLLSKSIRGIKFGKQKITDAFNKYVPKSDYAQDEKEMILENLWNVTKVPEKAIFKALEKNTL